MNIVILTVNILAFMVLVFIAMWRTCSAPPEGRTRQEHLLLFLLATGMFRVGGFTILGLNSSALRLMMYIMIVFLCVVIYTGGKKSMGVFGYIYAIFLLYAFARVYDSPSLWYGVRNFLKYLYPFLIYLLAVKAVHTDCSSNWLKITFKSALIFAIFCSAFSGMIPYLFYWPLLAEIFWPRATFADYSAIMIGVCLCLWWIEYDMKRFYLFASIFLTASSVIVASRTGILASLGAYIFFFFGRFKLKALPFILGFIFLTLSAFVFLDALKKNTFRVNAGEINSISDLNSVNIDQIDSSGRFFMWGIALEKFYKPNRNFGSGLGALQNQFYEKGLTGSLKVVHCDYVTFLCDLGLIGLILFCLFPLLSILKGFKASFSGNFEIKIMGVLVMSSWAACLLAMGFDNVINYGLATTTYPFAFTGMLVGLTRLNKNMLMQKCIQPIQTGEIHDKLQNK